MANGAWNSFPSSTSQIACRLCNQVCSNREALIAHIDSHLAREEITLRTLNHQPHNQVQSFPSQLSETLRNHQFAPTSFPRVSLSPPVPEMNRNISDIRALWAPPGLTQVVPPSRINHTLFSVNVNKPSASAPMQPPLLGLSSTMNSHRCISTQPFQSRNVVDEIPISEGAQPFIKMLDKPIRKIEFIDLVNLDDEEMDLTLKL